MWALQYCDCEEAGGGCDCVQNDIMDGWAYTVFVQLWQMHEISSKTRAANEPSTKFSQSRRRHLAPSLQLYKHAAVLLTSQWRLSRRLVRAAGARGGPGGWWRTWCGSARSHSGRARRTATAGEAPLPLLWLQLVLSCAEVSHLYVPTRWQSSDGYSIPWAVAGESDQTPRTNPEQSRLSSNIREAERSVTSKLHFSRTLPQPPQQSTIYLLCCRWKLNSFNSNKSVDNVSTSTQRSVCWHCC